MGAGGCCGCGGCENPVRAAERIPINWNQVRLSISLPMIHRPPQSPASGGRRHRDLHLLPRPEHILAIYMRLEWDERKNRLNRKKHGIAFSLAARVFADECRILGKDRIDEETGEQR